MKDSRTPEQRVRDRVRKELLIHRHDAQALLDELDQQRIRAEAAEAELDAYRRTERVQERRAS